MKRPIFVFVRFLLAVLVGTITTLSIHSQESELLSRASVGDVDAVKAIVESGVNINAQDDSYGYTALTSACEHNYVEMARYLLSKGADPNVRANDGSTALIRAAGNAPDAVKLVLSAGGDVNARADDGSGVITQCMFGILYKGYPMSLAEVIVPQVDDVDEVFTAPESIAGYTPLFFAARDNHEPFAGLLIEHGADVNAVAEDGSTPLQLADAAGHREMVRLLRSNGAR